MTNEKKLKKKYPYQDRMKQINAYLPKTTWNLIDKYKLVGETTTIFMKRAIHNLIGMRINLKKKYGNYDSEEIELLIEGKSLVESKE